MGFLSALGKIAGFVPLPGMSTVGKVLEGVGDTSGVLGKQQAGEAAGREAQAAAQQAQDRNALSLYQTQQGAENSAAQTDLARKQYSDQSRTTNAKQALMAKLLGGGLGGPSSVSVPGVTAAKVGGGPLAGLMNNPEALATLKELASQADQGLTNPAPFTGGNMVKAPTLTPLPTQSGGSSFLDTLARVGQIAGAAAPTIQGFENGGSGTPYVDPRTGKTAAPVNWNR